MSDGHIYLIRFGGSASNRLRSSLYFSFLTLRSPYVCLAFYHLFWPDCLSLSFSNLLAWSVFFQMPSQLHSPAHQRHRRAPRVRKSEGRGLQRTVKGPPSNAHPLPPPFRLKGQHVIITQLKNIHVIFATGRLATPQTRLWHSPDDFCVIEG